MSETRGCFSRSWCCPFFPNHRASVRPSLHTFRPTSSLSLAFLEMPHLRFIPFCVPSLPHVSTDVCPVRIYGSLCPGLGSSPLACRETFQSLMWPLSREFIMSPPRLWFKTAAAVCVCGLCGEAGRPGPGGVFVGGGWVRRQTQSCALPLCATLGPAA